MVTGSACLCLAVLVPTAINQAPTLAYTGCNSASSAGTSSANVNGGQSVDFSVTIKDCNGQAVAGVQVSFAQQTGPANCRAVFDPPTAVTDANGHASTTVTLPLGCPCQYTLSATGGGVTLLATVRENGCLPFTGAAAPPVVRDLPTGLSLGVAMLLAGLILGAVAWWLPRRLRA